MHLECHCFNSVFMFYSLLHFIIDVLKTVDSGLWMYIHMIITNHLPIKVRNINGDMCAYFELNTSTRKYRDIACRLWEYTHT